MGTEKETAIEVSIFFFFFCFSILEIRRNIFSSGFYVAGSIKCTNRGQNNAVILQLEGKERGASVGKKEENSFFWKRTGRGLSGLRMDLRRDAFRKNLLRFARKSVRMQARKHQV